MLPFKDPAAALAGLTPRVPKLENIKITATNEIAALKSCLAFRNRMSVIFMIYSPVI
jgi:hypothetical protein